MQRQRRRLFIFESKYGGDKKELYKHLEPRKDTDLRKALDQIKNTHLSVCAPRKQLACDTDTNLQSTRQYSQTAYRFGDCVVKYCLVPSSETQKKQAEETVKPESQLDDILSEWLKEFHRNHDAEYLF